MVYSRTRRRFTREFKEEAVQLVVSQGKVAKEVADNLGVHANVLRRWVREYREDPLFSFPGNGNLKAPEEEVRQLQKQLADTQMERDILKKALAIFSRPSR